MPRALLVRNAQSRTGDRDLTEIYDLWRDAGLDWDEIHPDADAAAAAIAQRGVDYDLVFVAGGDGSLNGALPGLLAADRPMAVLPLGTANDFARSIGLPPDPRPAAELLLDGIEHRVDLGEVNGSLYLNVAGIGLGPEVTERLDADVKQRWGPLAYPRALMSAWRDMRPFAATVLVDGAPRTIETLQISVGNGRHYGGGAVIDRDATADDGLLVLHSVDPMPLARLCAHAWALSRGRARDTPGHMVAEARRIAVHTREPLPVTADGELLATTPARFKVVPRALRVLVPKRYFEVRREWLGAA